MSIIIRIVERCCCVNNPNDLLLLFRVMILRPLDTLCYNKMEHQQVCQLSCDGMPQLVIPSCLPLPSSPPPSSQRRLTDIWQLPPPYIADHSTPVAAARMMQQPLTAFFTCTTPTQPSHSTAPAVAPCTTPAPMALRTQRHSQSANGTNLRTPPQSCDCSATSPYH